jgi:hypothetical protein
MEPLELDHVTLRIRSPKDNNVVTPKEYLKYYNKYKYTEHDSVLQCGILSIIIGFLSIGIIILLVDLADLINYEIRLHS